MEGDNAGYDPKNGSQEAPIPINNQLSGEIDDGVADVVDNFRGENEVEICAKDGACKIWGEELPNVKPNRRSDNPG